MTDSPVTELSPQAEEHFAEYLRRMRLALAGVPDVNPEEIEADVRDHVENELRADPKPVSLRRLEEVLTRLGPPEQWAGERSSLMGRAGFLVKERLARGRARLRTAWDVLYRGTEDWRLAYLSFGTFALGVLAFPLFPLFLILSYILSRAGIAAAKQKGIEIDGARKWLLYPPVAIVSAALTVAAITVPLVAVPIVADETRRADHQERWELAGKPRNPKQPPTVGAYGFSHENLRKQFPEVETTLDKLLATFPGPRDVQEGLAILLVGIGICSTWWMILAGLATMVPGVVRGVFFPLYGGFERKHGLRALAVSTALFTIFFVLSWEVVAKSGLT